MTKPLSSHEKWLLRLRDRLREERYHPGNARQCVAVARNFLVFLELRRTVIGDAIAGGDVVDAAGSDGPFDIIYSFGLFDYLSDDFLLHTVRNFLPLLAEGGQLIFCLKDRRHFDSLPADWLYNWRFVARTADDGPRLASALDLKVAQTWYVRDRCIAVWACERR